jgi:predicted RNase H-like HicB family nuclease
MVCPYKTRYSPRPRNSTNPKSLSRQSCWEPLKQVGAIISAMGKGRQRTKVREFTVLIEQDEDGYYVASVPALHSCYTQARTLEELAPRIREVITLCLAEQKAPRMKFVGVQQVEVSA